MIGERHGRGAGQGEWRSGLLVSRAGRSDLLDNPSPCLDEVAQAEHTVLVSHILIVLVNQQNFDFNFKGFSPEERKWEALSNRARQDFLNLVPIQPICWVVLCSAEPHRYPFVPALACPITAQPLHL